MHHAGFMDDHLSIIPTISQKKTKNFKSSPRYELSLMHAQIRSTGCDIGRVSDAYFLSSRKIANNRHVLKI